MRRLFTFVLGAASGALIGAAVAILMAPASGEDLRGDFRSRFNRLRDELQNAAAQRREESNNNCMGCGTRLKKHR